MSTFLFDSLVFGPVKSRRLGSSLGINLLPVDAKFCNFDCAYCECGWTPDTRYPAYPFPAREQVKQELERRLVDLDEHGPVVDAITFAGNGEPTLHPDFAAIMQDTLILRKLYCPSARIAVLSNATRVHEPKVREGLMLADIHMLKLDAGKEETFQLLNSPPKGFTLEKLMVNLSVFKQGLVIQSLFVRGTIHGEWLDNSLPDEVDAWLQRIIALKPEKVIIYSIERDTAAEGLMKIPGPELEEIARKVGKAGIRAEVY